MPDLGKWITQPRLEEYLVAANRDENAARELYEWNADVSSAFFELIAYVEVILRNSVDHILQPLEVVESARVLPRNGWWFSSSTFLEDHDLEFYRTAIRRFGSDSHAVGRDKTLATLTFGIWAAVFSKSYEQLFRSHLVYAFPHRDEGFKRETVQQRVLALRNLRNRIAHHQAIFDLPLEERYEQAMDLLRWIDPEVEQWVTNLCRVPSLLDGRPAAAESIVVVVPAVDAWPFYLSHGAYICQPGRFFKNVSHIAFYKDAAIQPEVATILERDDHVAWAPTEVGRRIRLGTPHDRRIAEIIRDSRTTIWTGTEYQLFLLSRPDNAGREKGHVTLPAPIVQTKRGRGSAWVQRQRYVSLSALQSASSVADLDAQ